MIINVTEFERQTLAYILYVIRKHARKDYFDPTNSVRFTFDDQLSGDEFHAVWMLGLKMMQNPDTHAGSEADSLPGQEPSLAPAPCHTRMMKPIPMTTTPTHEIKLKQDFETSDGYTCLSSGWHDAIKAYTCGYILTNYGDFVHDDLVEEVRTL